MNDDLIERVIEACAKVCDTLYNEVAITCAWDDGESTGYELAGKAIRALDRTQFNAAGQRGDAMHCHKHGGYGFVNDCVVCNSPAKPTLTKEQIEEWRDWAMRSPAVARSFTARLICDQAILAITERELRLEAEKDAADFAEELWGDFLKFDSDHNLVCKHCDREHNGQDWTKMIHEDFCIVNRAKKYIAAIDSAIQSAKSKLTKELNHG